MPYVPAATAPSGSPYRELPPPDEAWVRGVKLELDTRPRMQETTSRRAEQQAGRNTENTRDSWMRHSSAGGLKETPLKDDQRRNDTKIQSASNVTRQVSEGTDHTR